MIKIEIDRNKKCQEIIETLKNMKELYLDTENIYTEFIIFDEDFSIIDNNQIINNCIFPLKEIYIYEVLNYEGIKKVFGYDDLINPSDLIKKFNDKKNISNLEMSSSKELIIKEAQNINKNKKGIDNQSSSNVSNKNNISEILIEIKHRCRRDTNDKRKYFFIQTYEEMSVYKDFIILTNKNSIKPYHLYDMIWEKYLYFLDNPYNKQLWWKKNDKTGKKTGVSPQKIKCCSPFVLKIVQKINFACAFCPWFKMCTGCVVSPENDDFINLNENVIIIVEWCKEIEEKELNQNNITLKLYHSSFKKEFNSLAKNKYNKISIYDCFDLFTQKETVKDVLCENCNKKTDFTKELKIERLPEYLFIVFKRFKYISKYSTKLESIISFPFDNLQLDNYLINKTKYYKKYDLYALINHNGQLSRGHYYCSVKQDNRWIKYDDSYVVEDDDINISDVYILVYTANNKEYYEKKKYQFHFNFLGLMNTAYKIYLNQYNFEHLFNYLLNEKEEIVEEYMNNCQYYYGEPVKINNNYGYLVNAYKEKEEIFVKVKTNDGFINSKIGNEKIKETLKEEIKEVKNDVILNNQNKAICSGCNIY